MEGFLIQQADKNERDKIFALYRQVVTTPSLSGYSGWCKEYPTLDILEEDLKDGIVLAAWDGQELIGAVSLLPEDHMDCFEVQWTGEKACMLARLCIAPGWQGKGLGARLAEEALGYAREQGYLSIRLLAATENHAAVAIYQKQSYRQVGRVFAYGEHFFCMEKII